MLTKSDLEAIKNLIKESETRVKNEITKFKDEIVARLDKIDQELTITNGYGDKTYYSFLLRGILFL